MSEVSESTRQEGDEWSSSVGGSVYRPTSASPIPHPMLYDLCVKYVE